MNTNAFCYFLLAVTCLFGSAIARALPQDEKEEITNVLSRR